MGTRTEFPILPPVYFELESPPERPALSPLRRNRPPVFALLGRRETLFLDFVPRGAVELLFASARRGLNSIDTIADRAGRLPALKFDCRVIHRYGGDKGLKKCVSFDAHR